jgi:formylglycine-generating enzyme required for sulfatase activity
MGGTNKDNAPCDVAVADFWIGKYPLTQAQWEAVMGDKHPNPSFYKDKNRPVETISWHDARWFATILNGIIKSDAILIHKKFALPTETQWEYAACGGVDWRDNFVYAGSNTLAEVAWYDENSQNETKPVGEKLPNQLGIYDMSGNVSEWCLSKYVDDSYDEADGRNAPDDSNDWRVLRGGSWNDYADHCACIIRSQDRPTVRVNDTGFRLCLLPV